MEKANFSLKILYEDNHLIAVFKPAGVLVQGDKPVGEQREPTLMDEVKKYLKEKYKKPGNVFLGLVHRLDRPVSGIILFAKTSKGAARISEQIRERKMSKIYHAVIEGRINPTSGKLKSFLKKDEEKRIAIISKEGEVDSTGSPRGDYAELDYETIKSGETRSLLKINLKTGRFHQIRAQLAAIGHPIVGDIKYGFVSPKQNAKADASKSFPDKSIALCATELTFQTATAPTLGSDGAGEIKTIRINYPDNWRKLF